MQHFSAEHVAALVATVVAAVLLVALARDRDDRRAARAGRALAILIAAAYASEHLTYAIRGAWTVRVNLPLHLTDAVTLLTVAALWRPSPILVELLYFWAFSATLQAVLTPDLAQSFPDALYFTYFVTHSGAIAAACLLVLGCRRIPRPGAVWRAYAVTVAFACLAAIGTVLTGGNYMFLRRKPASGSLLDVMGPWPLYILGGAALGLAIFLVLEAVARALRSRERSVAMGEHAPG
jgi:hypothetical integral membrane protein (TIGR02206 family)